MNMRASPHEWLDLACVEPLSRTWAIHFHCDDQVGITNASHFNMADPRKPLAGVMTSVPTVQKGAKGLRHVFASSCRFSLLLVHTILAILVFTSGRLDHLSTTRLSSHKSQNLTNHNLGEPNHKWEVFNPRASSSLAFRVLVQVMRPLNSISSLIESRVDPRIPAKAGLVENSRAYGLMLVMQEFTRTKPPD
jgi:hypothetical protein